MWCNGIPNKKIKPFKYINGTDLASDVCRKAFSNAKTVIKILSQHFPLNFERLTGSDRDEAIAKAYQDLVRKITEKEDGKIRDYVTMNYCSLYTLLSENKLIKNNS